MLPFMMMGGGMNNPMLMLNMLEKMDDSSVDEMIPLLMMQNPAFQNNPAVSHTTNESYLSSILIGLKLVSEYDANDTTDKAKSTRANTRTRARQWRGTGS